MGLAPGPQESPSPSVTMNSHGSYISLGPSAMEGRLLSEPETKLSQGLPLRNGTHSCKETGMSMIRVPCATKCKTHVLFSHTDTLACTQAEEGDYIHNFSFYVLRRSLNTTEPISTTGHTSTSRGRQIFLCFPLRMGTKWNCHRFSSLLKCPLPA